jgi:protocatechuate 3,4-dioxygenase beta subunit
MLMVCSLLALTLAQPPAAAEQGGRISGQVTLEGANTPVSGARIILVPSSRPVGPMGPPPQAITDQAGRFAFDRVPPGTYRLDAQKAGLAPADDAFRGRTITVTAGQSTGVVLQLQKGAAITGRVVDPIGQPLTEARVMVLRRMPMPAGGARGLPPMPRLIPVPSPGTQTNDLGEFRVSGLAPGEYFVAVSPRSIAMFGTAGSNPARDWKMARTTLPTTYYPGTSDQAAAQPIAVAAGAEVGNINFAMQPVPAFRVSGVVVDEEGKPVGGAMVMLMADSSLGLMGPVGNSMSQPNGRFDIDDVPAGSYRANSSIMMRVTESGGGSTIGSGAVTWSSSAGSGGGATPQPPVEIVVADADVTGVQVVVRRPNPR